MYKPNIRPMMVALALLLAGLSPSAVFAASAPFDDADVRKAEYPQWFLDSELDLNFAELIGDARGAGKKGLIVVFGTARCSYCYKFADETLRDPRVVEAMQNDFQAIALEIFSDTEMVNPQSRPMAVKDYAVQLRADYTPTVFFLGHDGEPRLRLFGFNPPDRFLHALRYVAGEHFLDGPFREFLAAADVARPAQQTHLPLDDPLFGRPPHALARQPFPADRHLLVVFDGPQCDECAYLFGTLFHDPGLRPQLEQMEVVRLHLNDTSPLVRPDGTRTTAAQWHAELGFHRTPAVAFFTPDGRMAMRSDALMLRQRLDNTLGYVLEEAYREGITYQRFARRRALARAQRTDGAAAVRPSQRGVSGSGVKEMIAN